MFKRIIPLASVALLLFSCGSATKSTEVKVNISYASNPKMILVSDNFDAKKEQKFTFTINHSDLVEGIYDYIGSVLTFTKGSDISQPTFVELIDEKKSINVLYNNKKMKEFKDGYQTFLDYYRSREEEKIKEIDGTYVFLPLLPPGKSEFGQSILLCHTNKKDTDKITCSITSAIDEVDITALYLNFID